jgi:chromosome condensin MukBEF MukE localization factor
MEDTDNKQAVGYAFLEIPEVEKYFADLNTKLLAGRHIQNDDYYLFLALEEYGLQFAFFYERLYNLKLNYGLHDGVKYYYLDFFDAGKGKSMDISRYRALTELQTVIGLMLINMYYAKYFQNPKIITWSDIRKEIQFGDLKEKYQKILFDEVKEEYIGSEWSNVEKNFKNTINSFHEFGWVKKQFQQSEEIKFEITASIHRLAELYKEEIDNFAVFTEKISNWKEE